jgi:hypothetical protein
MARRESMQRECSTDPRGACGNVAGMRPDFGMASTGVSSKLERDAPIPGDAAIAEVQLTTISRAFKQL